MTKSIVPNAAMRLCHLANIGDGNVRMDQSGGEIAVTEIIGQIMGSEEPD